MDLDDDIIAQLRERAMKVHVVLGLLAEGYIDEDTLAVFDHGPFHGHTIVPFYPPGRIGNDG